MPHPYAREDDGQPPSLHPPYRSTAARSPHQPLVKIPHTLTELTGPADWNALLEQPDTLVIDTRNAFEVAMGTFQGAIDPDIRNFGQFKDFAATLYPVKHRRIAMFCTGGIRCEKASSLLLAQGFAEVYHLKGGILKYLEDVPEADSRWRGECFVFDERVALGHGLQQRQPNDGSHE